MQFARSLPALLLASTIAAAIILHSFVDHAVPVQAVPRPLLVSIFGTLILSALAALIWRPCRGCVIAALVLLALTVHGPGPLVAALGAALVIGILLIDLRFTVNWERLSSGLLIFASALLLLALGRVALTFERVVADLEPRPQIGANAAERGLPDIYIILLDAYPRADTLASVFDYDNGPFIEKLTTWGFDHYPDSRSNYPSTTLSMTSVLRGELFSDDPLPQPERRYAAWAAPMVEIARQHGYEFVTISPGWDELAVRRADRFLDSGGLGQFEQSLIQLNGFGWVVSTILPDFLGDQRRARVEFVLSELGELAEEASDQPRLVWAHLPAPHYPLLYGPGGKPSQVAIADFDSYDRGIPTDDFIANIDTINRRVLAGIEPLVSDDAVVVLWSDHGSLTGLGSEEEAVRNLLVARTPGHSDLFGATPSPVQILPRLLNAYMGEEIAVPDSKSFVFGTSREQLRPILP